MKSGKRILALILMAVLLLPQNIYGAELSSADTVGTAVTAGNNTETTGEDASVSSIAESNTAGSEDNQSGNDLGESKETQDANAAPADLSTGETVTQNNSTETPAEDSSKSEEQTSSVPVTETGIDSNGTDISHVDADSTTADSTAAGSTAVDSTTADSTTTESSAAVSRPVDESKADSSTKTSADGKAADESVKEVALEELTETEEKDRTAEEVVGAPSNDAKLATGVYYICMKQNYKMFLGSKGNSEAHCSNIEIVQKNSSKKQRWVITALGNGRYSIWNYSSGMALGVSGVTLKDRANISQYRRNYKNVKQFYIRKTTDGAVIIQPVGASFVLGAASSNVKPGINIRLKEYSGQNEVKWRCVLAPTTSMSVGTYIIHSKLDDSKYISIKDSSKNSGGNCILSGKSGAKQMTVYSAASGKYLIHPACSNFTLTAYHTIKNGSDVRQYKVTNAGRQLWTFYNEGNGYYSIRLSRDTSMALDISGGSTKEGTNVQIYKYNGSDGQLFSFEKTDGNRILPNGYYALKTSLKTSMAAEIANNSKSAGANVQLGTYNDKNKQKFYIFYRGNGLYSIRNVRSGMCLAVSGASNSNGANVIQSKSSNIDAQKWKPVGSAGVFYFKSALGNKALDVSGASSAAGTNIQIYSVNKSAAQKFKLVPVIVNTEKEFIVAIDAGHQRHQNTGKEPIGPGSSTLKQKVSSGTDGRWSGLSEYELNLQVSLKLQAELENRGYSVYMIRTTHDVNISNAERATMAANAGADIFIRIHANGSDSSSVRGALNYMPSSSNPYLTQSVIAGSQKLARVILESYCAATGMPNLGLLTGDDMTGINWAKMPVTIVEMGFMSNRTDDLYMASAAGQAQIVQGIANGVDRYFAS